MNQPPLLEWMKAIQEKIKPDEPDTDVIKRRLKNLRKAVNGIGWMDTNHRRESLLLIAAELHELADDIQNDIQITQEWEKKHPDG